MSERGNADFAAKVDALYALAIAGKPSNAKHERREVREVAFALAQIRNLIEDAAKETRLSALPETALVAASDLLDALMSGTNHPIWRYLREGQSRKRINKAPPSALGKLRRASIVGIFRSLLRNDAQLSRRDAAQKLAGCGPAIDAALTPDQIIGWDKVFSEHEDRAPDAITADILRLASKAGGGGPCREETILKVGLGRAYFLWALPGSPAYDLEKLSSGIDPTS
jgi:hypothetical protein